MVTPSFVYVCSPYRGDVENNLKNARNYCRYVVNKGYIPFCPHIYFTQFLDDNNSGQRKLAMLMNLLILKSFCNYVYVFGSHISEGMQLEIDEANKLGIPIDFISCDKYGTIKGED